MRDLAYVEIIPSFLAKHYTCRTFGHVWVTKKAWRLVLVASTWSSPCEPSVGHRLDCEPMEWSTPVVFSFLATIVINFKPIGRICNVDVDVVINVAWVLEPGDRLSKVRWYRYWQVVTHGPGNHTPMYRNALSSFHCPTSWQVVPIWNVGCVFLSMFFDILFCVSCSH